MQLAFSSLACPGWTIEEIAAAARDLGYDGVEWRLADGSLLGRRTEEDVWRRIANSGVTAACLDTSAVFVQAETDARDEAVEIAAAMGERAMQIGAPFIRVFAGHLPQGVDLVVPTREALDSASQRMPEGVRLLVETHDAWSRGADIVSLIDGLDRVGVLWDVAHSVRAGESPSDTLDHIGLPALVHIKDAIGEELVPPGEGAIPLRDTVELLRSRGYDGWLSFEWEKLWHPDLMGAESVLPQAAEFLRGF